MIAPRRRPTVHRRAIAQSELPVDLRTRALVSARLEPIKISVPVPTDLLLTDRLVRVAIGRKLIVRRERPRPAGNQFGIQPLRRAQPADVTEPAPVGLGHPVWLQMRRRPHPRCSAPRDKRRDRARSIWIVVLMTMTIRAAKPQMPLQIRRLAV